MALAGSCLCCCWGWRGGLIMVGCCLWVEKGRGNEGRRGGDSGGGWREGFCFMDWHFYVTVLVIHVRRPSSSSPSSCFFFSPCIVRWWDSFEICNLRCLGLLNMQVFESTLFSVYLFRLMIVVKFLLPNHKKDIHLLESSATRLRNDAPDEGSTVRGKTEVTHLFTIGK